ncbi:hypothetical protein [Nostoc sp. FACHB-280]|uniref:hypothetical protein n=1 Tax=Nostoc sp. FACHB-280 TaxID=2692839 RepID=UPI00168A41A5|nr:hypothetical protein [Nostoc sp. FACHB-280]MBD2496770.1 hypothetical protein [Nostoc sp. FACHB-280]
MDAMTFQTKDELGFCTRQNDGVSGMTVTALANFCGTEQHTITQLLKKIRDSDFKTNELAECLKPFASKELRTSLNDSYGTVLVGFDACKAITKYFACTARKYKGRNIARMRFAQIEALLSYGLTVSEALNTTIENTKNLKVRADSHKRIFKQGTQGTERKIQMRFEKELKGKTNVIVPTGYIDVLTSTEIIEIKQASDWKYAVGQVTCYALYYPSHQKRLHLFGDTHEKFQQLVQECCLKLNIRVTWEETLTE